LETNQLFTTLSLALIASNQHLIGHTATQASHPLQYSKKYFQSIFTLLSTNASIEIFLALGEAISSFKILYAGQTFLHNQQ
jgi:hypothetical protein